MNIYILFFSLLQPDQREIKIRFVFQFTSTPENERILYLQVMLNNINFAHTLHLY